MLCSKKKAPEISGFKSTLPEAISSIARVDIRTADRLDLRLFHAYSDDVKSHRGSVGMPITTRQLPGRARSKMGS
jgi:hypothetical protein